MTSEPDSSAEAPEHASEAQGAPESVGAKLRAARERKRLDLSHIAAETRIPMHHLEVIEAGEFDTLPSRTYAIGFARNYAKAVDLDEDEIADAVRDELSDGHERRTHHADRLEPGDPAKLPSSGLAWFGGAAAVILVIGVIVFSTSYFGQGADLPVLTAGTEIEEPAEQTETRQVRQAEPAGQAGSAPAPDSSGEVVFTALEDGIWVRFYERGGDRLFEAQMETGDTFTLPGDAREPLINTGRPDALAITIGGREVPKLSNAPETMGGEPISAPALLARAENDAPSAN